VKRDREIEEERRREERDGGEIVGERGASTSVFLVFATERERERERERGRERE
jgi:hypothetical protein